VGAAILERRQRLDRVEELGGHRHPAAAGVGLRDLAADPDHPFDEVEVAPLEPGRLADPERARLLEPLDQQRPLPQPAPDRCHCSFDGIDRSTRRTRGRFTFVDRAGFGSTSQKSRTSRSRPRYWPAVAGESSSRIFGDAGDDLVRGDRVRVAASRRGSAATSSSRRGSRPGLSATSVREAM
jgi:hypothetical protein